MTATVAVVASVAFLVAEVQYGTIPRFLLISFLFVAVPLLIFWVILKELRDVQRLGNLPVILTVHNGQLLIDRINRVDGPPISLDCDLIEWVRVDEVSRGGMFRITIQYAALDAIVIPFIEHDSKLAMEVGISLLQEIRAQPETAKIVADHSAQN